MKNAHFGRKRKREKENIGKRLFMKNIQRIKSLFILLTFLNTSVNRNAVWFGLVKKYYKIQEFPKYAVKVARAEIDDIDGFELLHLHSI